MVRLLGGDELPAENKVGIAARAYQSEILRICQKQNAIVRLDTGMGKTFIAIMLMRWINGLPRTDDVHRLNVFIVPTVALVDQQSEAIAKNTSLRVRPYRGDMGVDFWDTARWEQEFEATDCVVMTAQIWLAVLTHAYWTLDRVTLMILDECHHARGKSAYAQIMDEYHRCKRDSNFALPQILGLTASPLFNPDNPEQAFKKLEEKLDSVIVSVRDSKIEAEGYTWKPVEKPLYFSETGHHVAQTDIELMLHELEIWDMVDADRVMNRINDTKRALGPLACDVYIMNWLASLCDPVATKTSLTKIRASGRIGEVEALHREVKKRLDKLPYYGLGDVTDKVKELVNMLATYQHRQGFHAIIFVERRAYAQALAMILSKSQTLQAFIKPESFVGHGTTGAERLASEGMAVKHQRRVVEAFRTGEINLLVATNVAEEGLDFPHCNIIVRFDTMTTYKGYIQSRGRARKKDSEFIVMLERDSVEEIKWHSYAQAEGRLETLQQKRKNEDRELEEPELENTPRYISPKTGAVLTYGNAIALLDEACALLPTDAYSPPSRPRYELTILGAADFSVTAHLPMMPLLPPEHREIRGPEVRTKKGAKQAAAFEACKLLHRIGVLNDHLLPLREGKGDHARDADDELVDRTALPMQMEVEMVNVFGNVWAKDSPTIWLNEVKVTTPDGKVERFGLVCGERLDLHAPLTMHEPGAEFKVEVASLRRLNFRDAERNAALAKFDKFTRWVIKQVINRKLIAGPLLYLLTPLSSNEIGTFDVDWTTLEHPQSDIASLSQLTVGNLVMAPWQFMRKHVFTIHAIRPDLNSRNMPRIIGLTRRGRIFERTGNFGQALIDLLDYENIDITDLDMEQEMLHLRPWFSVRNNLNPIKAHQNASPAATAPQNSANTSYQRTETSRVPQEVDEDDLVPLAPWELPDWKWREYKIKQHEIDEEAEDMIDPESSIVDLHPLPRGKTTANSKDVVNAFVLPWSLCKISNISVGVWNAFSWLPSLMRAIHDQARTQQAMQSMGLPPLQFPLVTQALTLPMCCTGKDYQTLETIGDSALKLAVTIVVYNRYTAKDEGGLSTRRMNSIDNQHLRMKAIKKGLQNHLLTEFHRMRTWVASTLENGTVSADGKTVQKTVPRRALSDCIEALLGAAYLSGGFEAVLRTGDALGLCFGGPTPWHERYTLEGIVPRLPVGPGLLPLEEMLGYKFSYGQLLMQAITHRSFANASTHCQEREEFLGDAVLDNYVIDRLSRRFPTATPSHLTRLRSVLVSNSALGYLALKVLGLHRYILHSTPLLGEHFNRALEEATLFVHDDFVSEIWLFDPPKPAADAVEGIIGSIFIDCGWHLEPVFEVLDRIFEDLFRLLPNKESAPRDPSSRLRLYLQHKRCQASKLDIYVAPRPDILLPAVVTVTWHEIELARITHHSQASAKQLACKIALDTIRAWGDAEVERVCTCSDDLGERMAAHRGWKKEVEGVLKAASAGTGNAAGERAMIDMNADEFVDPRIVKRRAVAQDQEEELAKQVRAENKEKQLEKIMLESFGYNPAVPVEGEEEDEEAVQRAKDEAEKLELDMQAGAHDDGQAAERPGTAPAAQVNLMDFDDDEMIVSGQARSQGVTLMDNSDSDGEEDDDNDELVITKSG